MKKLISILALLLVGCGSDTYTSEEVVLPSDSTVVLDENQSIGFVPNADNNVQIVNVGEGAYYITCDGSEDCTVHIGNVDTTVTTDNNSSS